ncbi:hypothetical protein DUNSADRAFT_2661 [Dunaliella salina]|uniref:Encoded protein n=1 Tax=Dunaliella salina TaxID=3046 RepID=A0ABQ7H891_DUNSA|nr:hypothetical protein DUNSADRAFT_2661 [Dunaliella salina]|eukprot:KAF5843048.1 hypothetical protein DUNSADRAFT_2661 [Dunaliella salina]
MIPALNSQTSLASRAHAHYPSTCPQRAIKGTRPAHTIMAAASSNGANGAPEERRQLAVATQLVHASTSVEDPYGGSTPPLWQTATFRQPNATSNGPYDYTRSGNPTR